MGTPHIHAAAIHAFADGAKIEWRWNDGHSKWAPASNPSWSPHCQYRAVKEKIKYVVIRHLANLMKPAILYRKDHHAIKTLDMTQWEIVHEFELEDK